MTERRRILSRRQGFDPFRPASAVVNVEIAGLSERGTHRSHNEDHYLALRLGRFQETLATSLSSAELPSRFEECAYMMLVADGLGGGGAGALASRVALSTIAHLALRYGKWNVRVGLEESSAIKAQSEFFFRKIHEVVQRTAKTDASLAWMTTSLTAIYSAGVDLFFANIGHSRAYVLRDGALVRFTRDGPVNSLLGTGPAGLDPALEVEQRRIEDGDRVLLCSNGLTDATADDQIAEILATRRRPAEDCRALIDLAVREGATDDITAVIADYVVPHAP